VDPQRASRSWHHLALALLLVILVLFQGIIGGARAGEDAFISFRYAENVAEGVGLRFSPGDAPCEGYSNFLWVMALAAAHRIGVDTTFAAQLLGLCFAALTVVTLLWMGIRRRLRLYWLAPLALALNAHFIFYATFGLETSLFTFLVVASLHCSRPVELSARSAVAAVSSLLALALTRPEGIALALPILLAAWLLGGRRGAGARRWYLGSLAALLALFGLYTLWRYLVFGSLLSSPAMVKLFKWFPDTPDRLVGGLAYVTAFFSANPLLAPALVAAIAAPWVGAARRSAMHQSLALLVLVLVVIWEGGDSPDFRHWRFLVPALPLLLLGSAQLLEPAGRRLARRWGSWAVGGLGAAVALLLALHLPRQYASRSYLDHVSTSPTVAAAGILSDTVVDWETLAARSWRLDHAFRKQLSLEWLVGAWLRSRVEGPRLLATGQAGNIAYYSGLPVVDLVGLVSCEVSHAGGPDQICREVAARRPALFLVYDRDYRYFRKFLPIERYDLVRVFLHPIPPERRLADLGAHRYYLFARSGVLDCHGQQGAVRFPLGSQGYSLDRSCIVDFALPEGYY
jgi:hypothetical protein